MQNIYGNASYAPIMILAAAPLYNIMAVIILMVEGKREGDGAAPGVRKALLGVLKNPILWGILLGLPFALLDIKFPQMITTSLKSVSNIATPLALLAIGASFRFDGAKRCLKPALGATFLKLIGQAAVFLPVAIWLGFRESA